MKAKSLKLLNLIVGILLLFLFTTCNKSGDSNEPSTFTWTWSGTTYTANFKEAFLHSLSPTPIIIGGTGSSWISPGSGPRITVSSFNVGNYALGIGLTFIAPNGDNLQSTSGMLSITSNANDRLAGNFTATLINALGQTSSVNWIFYQFKNKSIAGPLSP